MITKTGLANEEILAVMRAEQSPRVRAYFDFASGRYKWVYHDPMFPMQHDDYGNQFLNSDGFAVEGVTLWAIKMWRDWGKRVWDGEYGFNPKRLFRPPHQPPVAPLQTSQTPAVTVL